MINFIKSKKIMSAILVFALMTGCFFAAGYKTTIVSLAGDETILASDGDQSEANTIIGEEETVDETEEEAVMPSDQVDESEAIQWESVLAEPRAEIAPWTITCEGYTEKTFENKVKNFENETLMPSTMDISFNFKSEDGQPSLGDPSILADNKKQLRVYKDGAPETTIVSGTDFVYEAKQGPRRLNFSISANSLEAGTTYILEAAPGLKDISGNITDITYNFKFTTASAESEEPFALSLINIQSGGVSVPVDEPILIGFNKPVDTENLIDENGQIQGLTLTVSGNGGGIAPSIRCSFSADNKILSITLGANLGYGVKYNINYPSFISHVSQEEGPVAESIKAGKFIFTTISLEKPMITNNNSSGAAVTSVAKGESYTASISIKNAAKATSKCNLYILVRGGMGAREDGGGDVIAQTKIPFEAIAGNALVVGELNFTIPETVLENIYIEAYTTTMDEAYANSVQSALTIPVN